MLKHAVHILGDKPEAFFWRLFPFLLVMAWFYSG